MGSTISSFFGLVRYILQAVAFGLIALGAIAVVGYTIASTAGYAPWLDLPLGFGGEIYLDAGRYVQAGFAALLLLLCFFLPTNARIIALENSHRNFHMGMRDVARAYALSHQADRQGVFKLRGEFDSIRERIAFLRDHPDLAEIEPSILELAAQMSHVSQELARTYSDSNVERARDFLTARQQEIETFNERLEHAKAVATEMRHWAMQVEMEEAVARAQLDRLNEDLRDLLPELQQGPERPDTAAEFASDAARDVPEDGEKIARLEPRAAE